MMMIWVLCSHTIFKRPKIGLNQTLSGNVGFKLVETVQVIHIEVVLAFLGVIIVRASFQFQPDTSVII